MTHRKCVYTWVYMYSIGQFNLVKRVIASDSNRLENSTIYYRFNRLGHYR